jgi:hypothetical protein
VTYKDVLSKVKLYLSNRQMEFVQHYEVLFRVAEQALGGGNEPSSTKKEQVFKPQTADEARAAIAQLRL